MLEEQARLEATAAGEEVTPSIETADKPSGKSPERNNSPTTIEEILAEEGRRQRAERRAAGEANVTPTPEPSEHSSSDYERPIQFDEVSLYSYFSSDTRPEDWVDDRFPNITDDEYTKSPKGIWAIQESWIYTSSKLKEPIPQNFNWRQLAVLDPTLQNIPITPKDPGLHRLCKLYAFEAPSPPDEILERITELQTERTALNLQPAPPPNWNRWGVWFFSHLLHGLREGKYHSQAIRKKLVDNGIVFDTAAQRSVWAKAGLGWPRTPYFTQPYPGFDGLHYEEEDATAQDEEETVGADIKATGTGYWSSDSEDVDMSAEEGKPESGYGRQDPDGAFTITHKDVKYDEWDPETEVSYTMATEEWTALNSPSKTIPAWATTYRMGNVSPANLNDKTYHPPPMTILDDGCMVIAMALVPTGTQRGKWYPFNFDQNGVPKASRPRFGAGVVIYRKVLNGETWEVVCKAFLVRTGYYVMGGKDITYNTIETVKNSTTKDDVIKAAKKLPSWWTYGQVEVPDRLAVRTRLLIELRSDGHDQKINWKGLVLSSHPGVWLRKWIDAGNVPMHVEPGTSDAAITTEGDDQPDDEPGLKLASPPKRPKTRASTAASTKDLTITPPTKKTGAKSGSGGPIKATPPSETKPTGFVAVNSPRRPQEGSSPATPFAGKGMSVDFLRGDSAEQRITRRSRDLLSMDREADDSLTQKQNTLSTTGKNSSATKSKKAAATRRDDGSTEEVSKPANSPLDLMPLDPTVTGTKRSFSGEGEPSTKRQRKDKGPSDKKVTIEVQAAVGDYFLQYDDHNPKQKGNSIFDKSQRKPFTQAILAAWKAKEDEAGLIDQRQEEYSPILQQHQVLTNAWLKQVTALEMQLARTQAQLADAQLGLYSQFHTTVNAVNHQPAQEHLRAAQETVVHLNTTGEVEMARIIALNIKSRLERDPPLMLTVDVDESLPDMIARIGNQMRRDQGQALGLQSAGTDDEAAAQLELTIQDESPDEIEGL